VAILSATGTNNPRTPRNTSGGTTCNATNALTNVECSYHYSNMIFEDAEMIAGNAEMPATSGTGTMVGNAGNGYARITRVPEVKVEIEGEVSYDITGATNQDVKATLVLNKTGVVLNT
jgi:hypothetical protein